MSKIVVYTAIFNNYDWLKEPVVVSQDVDYVCFTDNDKLRSDCWDIVIVKDEKLNPSLFNRKIKLIYPYTYFKDYDYSLYVDGSVMIKGDVGTFVEKYIQASPVLMNFKHPNNDCIFVEIEHCINEGRGNAEQLQKQYDIYKADGMPEHFGLSDNKIILRKNTELGYQLMQEWFDHVVNYSGRDQVCLSYILFKHNLKYSFFNEVIEKNEYFESWPHNNAPFYIVYWRKIRWFSERTGLGWSFIKFLNNKVKPLYLKHRVQ